MIAGRGVAGALALVTLIATPGLAAPPTTAPPPLPPPGAMAPAATAPAAAPPPVAHPAALSPAQPVPGAIAGEPAGADAAGPAKPESPEEATYERLVPTLDATPAESDHEAVRDAWGVQVRPVATKTPVFALRPVTGCASVTATSAAGDCAPATVSALSLRRWVNHTLAWNAGLALALGGGRENGRLLDTYFGVGPVLGVSVLLANWKHLAIAASPELTLVYFKGAGSLGSAYVAELLSALEAELHFGFIGVPALALSIRSGLGFRLERGNDTTVWSIGVGGATTVRGLFEELALRYYF